MHESHQPPDTTLLKLNAFHLTFGETVSAGIIASLKAYSKLQTSLSSSQGSAGHNWTNPQVHNIILQISYTGIKLRGTEGEQQTDFYHAAFAHVKFAPVVVDQAQRILQELHRISGTQGKFNGVHLRIERDVAPRHAQADALEKFLDAMSNKGFDQDTPLYIASGIFQADDEDIKRKVWQAVKPYCSQALNHLSNATLAQREVLDSLHSLTSLFLPRATHFSALMARACQPFLQTTGTFCILTARPASQII